MSDAFVLIALSTISTGLILGCIFALVAAGVTIVYGSIWLPNASNGQIFLLAALLAWSLTTNHNVPPALAIAIVMVIGIPLSWAIELVLIRRFYDVPDRNIAYFVMTLGMTQILTGIFSLTYGLWSDGFSFSLLVRMPNRPGTSTSAL